jgi:hypothetical protein
MVVVRAMLMIALVMVIAAPNHGLVITRVIVLIRLMAVILLAMIMMVVIAVLFIHVKRWVR